MNKKLIRNHFDNIEREVRLCLEKQDKKNLKFKMNIKALSKFITFLYFETLYSAFMDGSIKNITRTEREIDNLVDFFFK